MNHRELLETDVQIREAEVLELKDRLKRAKKGLRLAIKLRDMSAENK